MTTLAIKPLGFLARAADQCMNPLMRMLMELNGTPDESPQLTHRWNNHHLPLSAVEHLERHYMVHCAGLKEERRAWSLIRHLAFVGWRQYVVLEPAAREQWYPGWVADRSAGVSRIAQGGMARLLLGPGDVHFFGISVESGRQIPIREKGRGRLGDRGPYAQVPLL